MQQWNKKKKKKQWQYIKFAHLQKVTNILKIKRKNNTILVHKNLHNSIPKSELLRSLVFVMQLHPTFLYLLPKPTKKNEQNCV